MHHGMYSKWHGMDRQTCFDSILSVWNDLKWEYYDDTFPERQHYRDTLEHIKQSKVIGKAAESVDKAKGNGKKRKHEDHTEDMVSRKEVKRHRVANPAACPSRRSWWWWWIEFSF